MPHTDTSQPCTGRGMLGIWGGTLGEGGFWAHWRLHCYKKIHLNKKSKRTSTLFWIISPPIGFQKKNQLFWHEAPDQIELIRSVTWIALQGWRWTVANTCDWKALNGCQTSRGHNVWLKLSAVPQEASGTAPQSWVCVWNTNRGFTSDQRGQRWKRGRVPVAPVGLGGIPTAAFLICRTWPPLSPAGANGTDDI